MLYLGRFYDCIIMTSNMNFRQKMSLLLMVLAVGIFGGLLSFWFASILTVRDSTLKVEKIIEKQVYLESSSSITAINTIADSILTVVPLSTMKNLLLTPSILAEQCQADGKICQEMAVLLSSDGLVLYGGNNREMAAGELRAVDNAGREYELEELSKIDGFTFYRLIKSGESILPVEKRTKFFNLKPVMLNDLTGVALGQRSLVTRAQLGQYKRVEEGIVNERIELDDFLLNIDGQTSTVQLSFSSDDVEAQGIWFDLGGQLLSMRNNQGQELSGEDILGYMTRMMVNKKSFSPVNMGLRCVRLDKDLARRLNLKVDYGCLVAEGIDVGFKIKSGGLEKAGLSEKLGIRPGDIILEVDNNSLLNVSLLSLFNAKAYGESIQITVLRDGESLNLKGVL